MEPSLRLISLGRTSKSTCDGNIHQQPKKMCNNNGGKDGRMNAGESNRPCSSQHRSARTWTSDAKLDDKVGAGVDVAMYIRVEIFECRICALTTMPDPGHLCHGRASRQVRHRR